MHALLTAVCTVTVLRPACNMGVVGMQGGGGCCTRAGVGGGGGLTERGEDRGGNATLAVKQ